MAIIIQRPTLILKDEPNIMKISRAAVKAIPMVSAHPYFKKVRNWKHIALHYLSEPENQHEVVLFDGSQTQPEGILQVSPRAHNIFVLEAIVLHDYDNGWLTIPREDILEANDMELAFDSRYRQPNISAAIQNDNQGLITWDAAKETDSSTVYNLFRKTTGAYSVLATITGDRTYLDLNLDADVTYTYKVEIDDPAKYIPSTTTASIKPVRPATPINLKATTTPGQVTTSWSPIAQAGVTYNLYRSETSGVYTTPIATGLTGNGYIDNTVVGGTTYYYMVKSVKTFESLASAQVSIKPIGTFSITNVIPTSTTSVRVDFSIAAGADSYNLFYKNATAGSYTQITGAVSPRNITGLTEGETYLFYATAINAYSSYTTPTESETMPKTSGVPMNFTASQWQDGLVTLRWAAATDADEYWIYKSTSANGAYIKIASTSNLTYNDATVVNGTTYYYKISSVNLHEGLEIEGAKTGAVSGYPNKLVANITKVNGTSTTKTPVTYTAFTNAPAGMISKIEIRHFNKNGVQQNLFTSTSGLATYSPATLQLDLFTEYAAYATVYMNNPDGNQTAQSTTLYHITASNVPKMKSSSTDWDGYTINWELGTGNNSVILYRSTNVNMTNPVQIYQGPLTSFREESTPAGTTYYHAAKGFTNSWTWTGTQIGNNPAPTSLTSDVSAFSNVITGYKTVYNAAPLSIQLSGSQYTTNFGSYGNMRSYPNCITAVDVNYYANNVYYDTVKLFKSTNKTTWTEITLPNAASGSNFSGKVDSNVSPGTTYYYKITAREKRVNVVRTSEVIGIKPVNGSYSATLISASVTRVAGGHSHTNIITGAPSSAEPYDHFAFSWNKNTTNAQYTGWSYGRGNNFEGAGMVTSIHFTQDGPFFPLSEDYPVQMYWYNPVTVDAGGSRIERASARAQGFGNGSQLWDTWWYRK